MVLGLSVAFAVVCIVVVTGVAGYLVNKTVRK